jgi:hypothetical protein
MTPQEILNHLKDEGDSTHLAISIYLEKLNTFNRDHDRQNSSVNFKTETTFRGRGKGGGGEGGGGGGRKGGDIYSIRWQ